jgi:hypothetical protein
LNNFFFAHFFNDVNEFVNISSNMGMITNIIQHRQTLS